MAKRRGSDSWRTDKLDNAASKALNDKYPSKNRGFEDAQISTKYNDYDGHKQLGYYPSLGQSSDFADTFCKDLDLSGANWEETNSFSNKDRTKEMSDYFKGNYKYEKGGRGWHLKEGTKKSKHIMKESTLIGLIDKAIFNVLNEGRRIGLDSVEGEYTYGFVFEFYYDDYYFDDNGNMFAGPFCGFILLDAHRRCKLRHIQRYVNQAFKVDNCFEVELLKSYRVDLSKVDKHLCRNLMSNGGVIYTGQKEITPDDLYNTEVLSNLLNRTNKFMDDLWNPYEDGEVPEDMKLSINESAYSFDEKNPHIDNAYTTIIFLQGGEDIYEKVSQMYGEGDIQGVINYLKQWDDGENGEITENEPHIAKYDNSYQDESGDGYVLLYNQSDGGSFLLYRPSSENELYWYNNIHNCRSGLYESISQTSNERMDVPFKKKHEFQICLLEQIIARLLTYFNTLKRSKSWDSTNRMLASMEYETKRAKQICYDLIEELGLDYMDM